MAVISHPHLNLRACFTARTKRGKVCLLDVDLSEHMWEAIRKQFSHLAGKKAIGGGFLLFVCLFCAFFFFFSVLCYPIYVVLSKELLFPLLQRFVSCEIPLGLFIALHREDLRSLSRVDWDKSIVQCIHLALQATCCMQLPHQSWSAKTQNNFEISAQDQA